MHTTLPVGFYSFHKNKFINYQLNRWHSEGYARREDLEDAATRIRDRSTYVEVLTELAERAEEEGRLKNAAFYYRGAEFLVEPGEERKQELFERFRNTFYRAFAEDELEEHKIVYGESFLAATKLAARRPKPRGTIVIHGGFDSFIEEFYCMWEYFADAGYDVIAFEGPGQGMTHRTYGVHFDHDWEKPVGAVLDHFGLDDVTVLGISMGGYWCLRAAAFEPRIKRVIALSVVYDWMAQTGPFIQSLVSKMVKWRWLMNPSVALKTKFATEIKHTMDHILFISDAEDYTDAVQWMLQMNREHLHSERVTQDVLLLAGENDAFQPPVLYEKQREALVNARSVTGRIFTEEEQADQHCQMGNLGLALDVMGEWLDGL